MQMQVAEFKSQSMSAGGWGGGRGFSVEVHTCLESLDKSQNTIYAEGTVTFYTQTGGQAGKREVVGTQTIDNRASDGKYFLAGKQIYTRADSKTCLQDILSKLTLIGRQNI